MTTGRLTTADAAREFVLAGNATITLVSTATGTRYTYRVRGKSNTEDGPFDIWFVSVMYGPDNEGDFVYLGTLRDGSGYRHGRKSRLPEGTRDHAFAWFWQRVQVGTLPDTIEVWHEGKCGRCGRKLTVPESIERGIGPECANRMEGLAA